MSEYFSLERLTNLLKNEIIGKWHDEGRENNHGSAGNTLEDLLGVQENNLKIPDWGEFELKTKSIESQSLVTLLHKEPYPRNAVNLLLQSMGWRHSKAGVSYSQHEQSFRSTTKANEYSDRGFCITLIDNKITLKFNPNKVNVTGADRTRVYANYGEWLRDIDTREPHYSSFFPVYWDKDEILEIIKSKIDKTVFCTYKTRKVGDRKQILFDSAVLFSDFDASNVDELFKSHAFYVDFDARSGHNHGTKFRVDVRKISQLFKNSKIIA